MDVTVAICTWNRANSLGRALESLTQMRIPDGLAWEVVVVNNNSTDDTDAVIGNYAKRLPIRREFEAKPGLSNARNRAVAAAKGAYLVWTDDDVLVDREWLAAYVDAFRRWPDAVLFGGKVLPELEEPVPAWLKESWHIVAGAFALRDFGDQPLQLTLDGRRIPFGASFALRAEEQRAHPYNPELGLTPGRSLLGEETAVMEAILLAGKKGYWVPEAKLRHCIPQQRQTLQYLFDFYTALGRGNAYRDRDRTTARLFGVPRWLWPRIVRDAWQYHRHRLTSRPAVWMEYYAGYMVDRGELEFWRRRHQRGLYGAPAKRTGREERLAGGFSGRD
jgi:glycosyltransferase involved in cell wall biosynthesis